MKNITKTIVIVLVQLLFGCSSDNQENSNGSNDSDITLPILYTMSTSNITQNTANSGGEIYSDGGSAIITRGICWSTSSNPTITLNTKTSNGTGTGSFTSNITGLISNTTYYIRAYATNAKGTAYGNTVSFITGSGIVLSIGMDYQGGKIAYFYKSGDVGYIPNEKHGIIVSPYAVHTYKKWNNGYNIKTYASNLEIGFGYTNTVKIVNTQGNGDYAAKYCYDLTINGYDDWYLPSLEESRIIVGFYYPVVGYVLWTSSEIDIDRTWNSRTDIFTIPAGSEKSTTLEVIPIRSF